MKRVDIYNQILNLFWTVIFFLPVIILWFNHYNPTFLFTFTAISLLPFFIPSKYFDLLQISNDRFFYESIGVKAFQGFTQNGRIINSILRKREPGYKVIPNRGSVHKFKSQIIIYEKYHVSCMLFFAISFIYGILHDKFYLAIFILVSLVLYHIIPLLIQQYNKIRIGNLG